MTADKNPPKPAVEVKQVVPACDNEIQIGDIVRLKSGGPAMTVVCLHGEPINLAQGEVLFYDYATVIFFNKKNRLIRNRISMRALVKSER